MFDSGIKASDLIAQIRDEADIAIPISDESYISWLNALEQLLYSEIIQEQKKYTFDIRSSLILNKENLNLWPLIDISPYEQMGGLPSMSVTEDGVYTFSLPPDRLESSEVEIFKSGVLAAGTYTVADFCAAYTDGKNLDMARLAIYNSDNSDEIVSISAHDPAYTRKVFTLYEDTPVTFILRTPDRCIFGDEGVRTVSPTLVAGSYRANRFVPLTTPLGVRLCDLPATNGESRVRFEDLRSVFVGDTQLIKTTLMSGTVFPNTYYKDDNRLGIHVTDKPDDITVTYIVRPALKTSETFRDLSVMLPVEFIDLAKAKLRGESYKLANEDSIAAKWLNDYNVLLETFKAWIAEKSPNFGM